MFTPDTATAQVSWLLVLLGIQVRWLLVLVLVASASSQLTTVK
jgi:hypothetical protein